jgi:hypothetical protein
VPAHASEFVHLVARLSAEELGDALVLLFDDVNRETGGSACQQQSVVLLRDAGQEARRVDAALRGEADEAPRRFVPHGRRDDIERVIEGRNESLER